MSSIRASRRQECSLVTESGQANFLNVMRKFTEANKPQCRTTQTIMPRVEREPQNFITGSRYEGTWDLLGVCGYGIYTYPNGVIYEGDFEDGLFHGEGEFHYEDGAVMKGTFNHGVMITRNLTFADGLEYTETDWKYCRQPDRRFTIEYDYGLQPAGDSFMTAEQPSVDLPPDTYDSGDGAFDPATLVVYKYDDPSYIIRAPSREEQKWTAANCRTSKPLVQKPRPYLYETWLYPELELPPMPPPAAMSVGAEISFYDFDKNKSEQFNFEDFEDPMWRRRRSTAANINASKYRKPMFYKPFDPAIIPRDTIPEDDDRDAAASVVTMGAISLGANSIGANSIGATSMGATSMGATSMGANSMGATSMGATSIN